MTDLKIVKDNFNKLIEAFEKQDITIEDIKQKAENTRNAAIVIVDKIESDIEGKIFTTDEDGNLIPVKPSKITNTMLRLGMEIQFNELLADLTNEKFMEESNGTESIER